VEVEEFGKAKQAWLETFLELPNGIPSHDTFGRVFARLDPEQFQACFLSWVQAINTVLPAQQIAIDGKTARRSHDRGAGKAAIQMVSAWATESHLVLAQRHVAEHSNEKTALPVLLEQLELAGCIVSIDAMGCHAKIARQIKQQEGEYVLALKDNQGTMYQDVVDLFDDALTPQGADLLHDSHTTQNSAHGRLERRQYWTIADPQGSPISMSRRRGLGCTVSAWWKRSGRWVSKFPANAAIISRAYRATPKPSERRSAATGRSKMAFIGCLISPFRRMPVACARITASRTLWCCGTWRSISLNTSPPPDVASKLGDSKPDGVKIIFVKSLPLKI
jgi:predicted transposase YbfD/YdcC